MRKKFKKAEQGLPGGTITKPNQEIVSKNEIEESNNTMILNQDFRELEEMKISTQNSRPGDLSKLFPKTLNMVVDRRNLFVAAGRLLSIHARSVLLMKLTSGLRSV